MSTESVPFEPDPEQRRVLDHERGPLLVTGVPGTGKSAALRERLARLVEAGTDPERVVLVVRTRGARDEARRSLLHRLARPLAAVRVLTVHGLSHHVMARRFETLGYSRPPDVLTAFDQLSTVRELLSGERPEDWPAYGGMLPLRGFADEVRQLLNRAQEALIQPEGLVERAEAAGLWGWRELGRFYRRYLDVLSGQGLVDFAGLVNQAAAASRGAEPPFDHVVVDDYQEATFAEEALLGGMGPESLVVGGDSGSHAFAFQGTTSVPLERFTRQFAGAAHVELRTPHRADRPSIRAWAAAHASEERAAAARELRRVHLEEGVPWGRMAVVVRRQGTDLGGILRALDDAGVPRTVGEAGLTLLAEPATLPFVLALRWLARPGERDGLVESLLTSELARLSPAAARGLVRGAQAAGEPPAAALGRSDGLSPSDAAALATLRRVLAAAEAVSARSVLDAFAELWKGLPYAARLVQAGEGSAEGRRDLDAVLALAEAVSRAGERSDASVEAFLDVVEAGAEGPALSGAASAGPEDGVRVLTAHGTAGREFDTVIVLGAVEGNFPSLARPEPMFDLALLEGPIAQAERNRRRLADERRLFTVVATRARRRIVLTSGDGGAEEPGPAARSRFVSEIGVPWTPAPAGPFDEPLSVVEAAASWRRRLADPARAPAERLASLGALLRLGERPSRWWFQRDWTGSAVPLHRSVRVSFSKLNTLDNCALQFVLSEELGLEGRPGYHAWVGQLVHKLIEECEAGAIPRTAEALAAAAEGRWRPQEFPSHAVSEAFRRTVAERMLPAWLAEYGKTEALARELRFEFEFEGATVTGYIDRVGAVQTGGTQITDYKTGSSRSKGRPEDQLQLGVYFLAVNRAEDLARFRPVKAVELAFLKDTDRDGRIARSNIGFNSRARVEFEEKMAARVSDLIARIRELVDTEVYRPSPSANCRYCDFKPLCPLWPEGKELFPAEGVRS